MRVRVKHTRVMYQADMNPRKIIVDDFIDKSVSRLL